jgi:NAD(P)-dependent dehydrogenase (short-subunit alcohol dehydrogenase family)
MLKGKYAVITGAAKGIGACAVKRFLDEGVAAVALVDLNLEAAEATARELDPTGERAFAFSCNVAKFEDTTRCFNEIKEKFGRIDILVNNAGITRDKTMLKMDVSDWHAVLAVDLTSLFYCCKQVLPGMMEQQYGKIINMSSMGFGGAHGQGNYAAAKYGVLGLTRVLAKEYAKYNITANAICPAAVATDMLNDMNPEVLAERLKQFPRNRAAKPEEIASVITFLASDDSSFVNGEKVIVTDGRMCN